MNTLMTADKSAPETTSAPFDWWSSASNVEIESPDGLAPSDSPISVEAIRRELPFTADLDDVSMVRAVHLAFHQGLPIEFIASKLGVRIPDPEEELGKESALSSQVIEVARQLTSAWAAESQLDRG